MFPWPLGHLYFCGHLYSTQFSSLSVFSSTCFFGTVASGDVQDELSVLGVSVYNQEDFEAGVLHQIDTEVQRRNTEQQKSFLIKEYNSVQSELK